MTVFWEVIYVFIAVYLFAICPVMQVYYETNEDIQLVSARLSHIPEIPL